MSANQSHQAPLRVAVIVGSLRQASYSRKIAQALVALAPATLACGFVEIGDLPLYSEDLDATPPASWSRFREEIAQSDAVLLVTPEYNRSVPGGLKNALDVGSRPDYPSVWDGLPAAVVSVSPYKLGGFGANHHLRQSLVFLNMPVMQQPEAYIGDAASLVDADNAVAAPEGRVFLQRVVDAFADWAALIGRHGARKAAS